jgi:hypothetical protein
MKPSGNNHIDQRITYLIDAYLRESITPEEHDELDAWVGASDENMRIFEEKTGANNEKIKEDKYKKYSSIWDILNSHRLQYSI